MTRTKRVVTLGILLAVEVVLSRFLSISTPIMKIGFAFIPMALAALMFGPWWAGGMAALADFLGAMLFPIGPYFPGFTLTAFLTGAIFGLLLHKKPYKWWRALIASALVGVLLTLGLGTLWLSMLWDEGYIALLPSRLLQCAVMIPLQTLVISTLCFRVDAWVRHGIVPFSGRKKNKKHKNTSET